MDVLDHLTDEHRRVEALIEELAPTEPGSSRDGLVDELTAMLEKHMAIEEEHVYPIVAEVLGDETDEEGHAEHDLTREGLAKLHELRAAPGFGAALDMVKAGIEHHVHEEEHTTFPGLREQAADQLAALDPAQLEAELGPEVEVIDVTRDELYQQAQAAGVPGRSKMTKDELAAAVQQVSSKNRSGG